MRIKYANPLRRFKLSRLPDKRYHLIRNLVTQLVLHERIVTTSAKAKHMRATVEAVIALARRFAYRDHRYVRGSLEQIITTNAARRKLMEELTPRLKDVKGAVTRVVYLRRRKGDNAPISYIEIVGK